MNENSETGQFSIEDAVDQLMPMEPDEGQPETEEETAIEADDTEETLEADEEDDSQAEEEDGDDEPEVDEDDDEPEMVYDLDGEEVSVDQLREWKKNGLFQKDYTQKTMAMAEDRKALEAERQATVQLQTQLKDQLASLAIEPNPEPNWAELNAQLTPQEFNQVQIQWQEKERQRTQVKEQYQLLQQQELQQIQQREYAALMDKQPTWAAPEVFAKVYEPMKAVAESIGMPAEELSNTPDHRIYIALNEIAELRAKVASYETAESAVKKKVVKAKPKLPAGAKPAKNQKTLKERQKHRDRVRKSGDINDAVDYLLNEM